MADNQVAIKSMIEAMRSLSAIKNEQNKLKINLLENSQKYRNNFLSEMALAKAKGQQEIEQEKALYPLKLKLEQDKAAITTPVQQLQIDAFKANPEAFSIDGDKIKRRGVTDMAESIFAKPEAEWTPNDRIIIGQYKSLISAKKGGGQVVGQDEQGNPIYGAPLSPTMQKLKAQDTQKILDQFETNKTKSALIDEVFSAIEKIPQGAMGSLQIKGMDIMGKNPMLEDIQKIKMVLTDAQLLNTANTKGAISDKEMALFQDAAANNNFSAPRIRPVLNKLKAFMKADETAAREAYIRNYGIDPIQDRGAIAGENVASGTKSTSPGVADSEGMKDGFQVGHQFKKGDITYTYLGNGQWSY